MRNLNRVTMIGQFTADPALKVLSAGQQVATGSLATNYSWKDKDGNWKDGVDFHNIVAWKQLAERMASQFKKGDKVFLEGKLRARQWTAEDGTQRRATEIVAHNVIPMTSEEAKKKVAAIPEPVAAETEEQLETEELTCVPVTQ